MPKCLSCCGLNRWVQDALDVLVPLSLLLWLKPVQGVFDVLVHLVRAHVETFSQFHRPPASHVLSVG